MKKTHVLLVAVMLVAAMLWLTFNGIVTNDESVNSEWSEVQNQLQRRSDLIPNLVKTVKGYAAHEKSIFIEVTEARAKVAQVVATDPTKLSSSSALQEQLLKAEQGLSSSLGRLIAVAENYPQLKASDNFAKLQDELAGTENRIGVARGRAIKATRAYNTSIRAFPGVVIASMWGFTAKEYYEAPMGAEALPEVQF
jgi:LemA protein